jgi:hypothetical protein
MAPQASETDREATYRAMVRKKRTGRDIGQGNEHLENEWKARLTLKPTTTRLEAYNHEYSQSNNGDDTGCCYSASQRLTALGVYTLHACAS